MCEPSLGSSSRPRSGHAIPATLCVSVCVGVAAYSARLGRRAVIASLDVHEGRKLSDASGSDLGAGVWLGLVLAATLTKLTASTDDVVWLLPFVSGKNRTRNVLFYILCMQLVVVIAWLFSFCGEALLALVVTESEEWPLSKILELISAILLTLYTGKLFYEWWKGDADDGSEGESRSAGATDATDAQEGATNPSEVEVEVGQASNKPAAASLSTKEDQQAPASGPAIDSVEVEAELPEPSTDSPQPPDVGKTQVIESVEADAEISASIGKDETDKSEILTDPSKYTLTKLFTISMFGSLDDFAVFVSLMLSGVFGAPQLAIGVFLGSLIVVVVCAAAGLFDCVVRLFERIPLWCIIGAFAVWTFVATFAM